MRLTLHTDRLTLRPFVEADAVRLAELAGDMAVARMASAIPHPYPPEAAAGWIMLQSHGRRRRSDYPFAIALPGEGLIGAVGLHCTGFEGEYELGYWIGRPYWGRGYATEAAGAAVDWARDDLGVDRLLAGHFDDNPASARVLCKLGFAPTGHVSRRFSFGRNADATCIGFERVFEAEPTSLTA